MKLNKIKTINLAKDTLKYNSKYIFNLKNFINDDFFNSVRLICNLKSKVVISGIGKSAIIANKISSTFNSIGIPSCFLHASDATHGDIGIIQKGDIIIIISQSGNTPEIKYLASLIFDNYKNEIISFTGNERSFLAKKSKFIINTYVDKEVCISNLAPTSSTTAQLAMSDALVVCIQSAINFSKEDFANNHPGGMLGKKLTLLVSDFVVSGSNTYVNEGDSLKNVVLNISSNRLGAVAIVDNSKLKGIITDGDIRRHLENNSDIDKTKAKDIMNNNPLYIEKHKLIDTAFKMMKNNDVSQLLVLEKNDYIGILHLHDLIKEGF